MYNPQIETLVQVADAGSFSKAAEKMYITSVSIMNQINTLERRIGVKLFERTNQGVELTEAGQSIYHDAKQIIAASEAAIERARKIAGVEQPIIRIGTSILRPCKRLIDLWARVDDGTQPFQIKIIPFEDTIITYVVDKRAFKSMISDLYDSVAEENGAEALLETCNVAQAG